VAISFYQKTDFEEEGIKKNAFFNENMWKK
jgi:hypothetical protein